MANRILRDGILTSERVDLLDLGAEVFYRRLMSVVDDYGRYYAKPELLRSACYPLRPDVLLDQVARWLQECSDARLLSTYTVQGKRYLELANFGQRTRTPRYPGPPNPLADGDEFSSSPDEFSSNTPRQGVKSAANCRKLPQTAANCRIGVGVSGVVSRVISKSGGKAARARAEAAAAAEPKEPLPPVEVAGTSVADAEEVGWIRQALYDFMGGQWGYPDLAVCTLIRRELGTHSLDELRELLMRKVQQQRIPKHSWGWFLRLVRDEFGTSQPDPTAAVSGAGTVAAPDAVRSRSAAG